VHVLVGAQRRIIIAKSEQPSMVGTELPDPKTQSLAIAEAAREPDDISPSSLVNVRSI
jgi:hypothetical protein